MVTRRFPLSGLFAALLALAAQLGISATVPRPDPVAEIAQLVILCHAPDPGAPDQAPRHHLDCLLCPLCAAVHAPVAPLPTVASAIIPSVVTEAAHAGLPPPSRAPPSSYRPPSQPRAPPVVA